jgi:tape measure domain-containing protein
MEVLLRADLARIQRDMTQARQLVSESMSGITRAVDLAKEALASIGIGVGIAQVAQLSDEYTKFTAQLRLATQSQREYGQSYVDVRRIAKDAQASLSGTGTLYARIANGTRELGISQQRVADITEVVNLGLKVSGATAAESASAQLQLSQAFAAGALRGEEFNAVNEAAPRLMLALADGLGVPVGALKKMASEGEITSQVMAEVLPGALQQLRTEASQVTTIAGAFTVLKNNVMEFVGQQAEANGTVALLAGGVSFLANNLTLLLGLVQTLTAAKVAAWVGAWVTEIHTKIAADQAARASSLAAMEADLARATASSAQAAATQAGIVVAREEVLARLAQAQANIASATASIEAATAAGAQSFALRTLRLATADLAEAEALRVAMVAELAILGQQQARVSAQATAATAAQAAATTALNAASTGAAAGAGLLRGALGLLGGPIGAVVTVLGLAATAWAVWRDTSKQATDQATEEVRISTAEIIADMNKQIERIEARNAAAARGVPTTKTETPAAARLVEVDAQIQRLIKREGEYAAGAELGNLTVGARADLLQKLGGQYNDLTVIVERFNKATADEAGRKNAKTHLDFLKEYGTKAEKAEAEIKKWKASLGDSFTSADEARIRKHFEAVDQGAKKEVSAYEQLVAAIKAKTAENDLEAQTSVNATESQKIGIKVAQELAAGTLKLSGARKASIQSLLDEQAASEKRLALQKSEREVAEWIGKSTIERKASAAALQEEYALYGKSADARAIAAIATRSEADLEKYLLEQRKAGRPLTEEMIGQLRTESAERVKVEQATLAQSRALGYAAQLAEENKRAAAESLADPRARAAALLQIDADIWQERIRLAGDGTEAQKRLQAEYNTWYANQSRKVVLDVDVTRATEVLKIFESLDDAARSAAGGMEASFGRVGKAIGGLTTALTGYSRTQAAIAAQLAAATKDAGGDRTKITKANADAAAASAQAQLKSYGDMASAAKGFFKESSTGYKTLEAVEKAYRAAEMAMALESMARKIFFKEGEVAANTALNATKLSGEAATTAASTGLAATEASAWGVTAVVKAIASMPFPLNLVAGAATLAAVVAVGAKLTGSLGGGGGANLAKDRQAAQGTGSVLGDSSAKSDSIAKSLEAIEQNSGIELSHTAGMLASLRSIENSIAGLGSLLVRTSGLATAVAPDKAGAAENFGRSTVGNFIAGGGLGVALDKITGGLTGKILGKVLGSVFGGKVTTLDTGLTADRASLAQVLAGGIHSSQYADTKKSGGWFSSDKYNTSLTALGREADDQFTKIIVGLADTVKQAGGLLGIGGDEFTQHLNSFVVEIGKVSLKDLKGEEVQKALEAVFSKVGDDMARFAVDGLQQFQKVGEGYFETLTRIASDYANVDSIMASIGRTFGSVGLASIEARERLITLVGGVDKLAEQTKNISDNFLSEAERLAPVQKYVTEQLASMGLSSITTRQQFKDLVLGMDVTTEAGAKQYAQLLGLADAFAQVYPEIEQTKSAAMSAADILSQRKDLQAQLDQLTLTSAQLRAQERASIDASNLALFDRITALQNEAAAHEAAAAAASNALGELSKAVDAEKAAINASYQAQADAIKKATDEAVEAARGQLQAAQDHVNAIKAVFSSLDRALESTAVQSAKFDAAQRSAAQALLQRAQAFAAKGGSLVGFDGLDDALSTVSKPSEQLFSSFVDYARDQARTGNLISQLKDSAGKEINYAQLTVSRIEDAITAIQQSGAEQLAALEKRRLEAITKLDALVTNAQSQLDVLNGVKTGVLSVSDALQAVAAALAGLKAAPAPSAGGAAGGVTGPSSPTQIIESLYSNLLGRQSDAEGLAWWVNAYNTGHSLEEITAGFKESEEYKNLHHFAVGTNFIPEDMPAYVHEGERIIPRADNRELMRRLSSPEANSEVLVEEVRALRTELAGLRRAGERTAQSSQKTADLIDSISAGGGPLLVTNEGGN